MEVLNQKGTADYLLIDKSFLCDYDITQWRFQTKKGTAQRLRYYYILQSELLVTDSTLVSY